MMYPPPPMQATPQMPGAQGYAPPNVHSTPIQGQAMPGQAMTPGYPSGVAMVGPAGPNSGVPGAQFPMGATGTTNDGLVTSNVASSLGAAGHVNAGRSGDLSNSTLDLSPNDKGGATSSAGGVSQSKDGTLGREHNRQISLLLAELDASKDLNTKVPIVIFYMILIAGIIRLRDNYKLMHFILFSAARQINHC